MVREEIYSKFYHSNTTFFVVFPYSLHLYSHSWLFTHSHVVHPAPFTIKHFPWCYTGILIIYSGNIIHKGDIYYFSILYRRAFKFPPKLYSNGTVRIFMHIAFSSYESLGKTLGCDILGQMVRLYLAFLNTFANLFFNLTLSTIKHQNVILK